MRGNSRINTIIVAAVIIAAAVMIRSADGQQEQPKPLAIGTVDLRQVFDDFERAKDWKDLILNGRGEEQQSLNDIRNERKDLRDQIDITTPGSSQRAELQRLLGRLGVEAADPAALRE